MVCQAMIIAMTVVLPEPVAIFNAMRARPGLASLLALSRRSKMLLLPLSPFRRDFRQPDQCFYGFHLAKERSDVGKLVCRQCVNIVRSPVHLPIIWIRDHPPLVDIVPDQVQYCRLCHIVLAGGKAFALIQDHCYLCSALRLGCLRLRGLGRGDELRGAGRRSMICWVVWPSLSRLQ